MAQSPKRPKRTPVSGNRDILTVSGKDENFEYRWVNDSGSRINQFKTAGYEVVTHDVVVGDNKVGAATAVGSVVDKPVGLGTTAVLMRIPKEFYEEDQKTIRDSNTETMAQMKQEAVSDGRYGKLDISK